MPEILEPGLFTQLFTSMVEEGAAETASMMNTLADLSVARARELLLTYRAEVFGASTSPHGEPPALRSGNLRSSIGHEEPKPGDYGTYSVLIGPRQGFTTSYGTHREASLYGGYLEHEQDHPFLKRAVREATALHRDLGGFRFTQWMGKGNGHPWGFR
ncbi:hypothetical protein KGQ19_16060 [Catenulispora sp. NL8]|uniref:HK97 gp10 family phage protein n=1 Tax=Catenulispora pinistramenti TaxID=2705254 RepID=A0ABS5KQQ2_9ACTN|nr:hypothetical protein [Catenulispora pinistramenti]MBS2548381.1 hypothetical protein [Catenulispora pinistramenti]